MLKEFYRKNRVMILYLFFGGLTTLVNLLVFWITAEQLHFSAGKATSVAWIIAVAFAYVVNRTCVFQSKNHAFTDILREAASFVGARIFSGIFDVCMMVILVDLLGFPGMPSKVFVGIAVTILNYAASKLFVFRKQNGREEKICEQVLIR